MSTYFKLGALIEGTASIATAGGTTALLATDKQVQVFTGTQSQTVTLPDATTLTVGRKFDISNRSTGSVIVKDFASTTLVTLAAGNQLTFRVSNVGTSAGSWAQSGDIGSSSAGNVAATAADSLKVLQALASGMNYNDGSSYVSKKAIINPEEIGGNYWLQRASLLTGQDRNPGFTFNGFGYNVGGFNSAVVERYDDTNNYWLVRASIPAPQDNLTGTFDLLGFGYSCGGTIGGTSQCSKYTDTTNVWSSAASLPAARSDGACASLNGFGYFPAGADSRNGTLQSTTYRYDPTGNTWSTRFPTTTIRYLHKTAALNNYVYISGGENTGGVSVTGTGEKYDDLLNSWSAIATTATTSGGHTGGFTQLGFFYVYEGGSTNTVYRYSDLTGLWTTVASTPSTHDDSKGIDINGFGYAVGAGASTARVDRYTASNFVQIPITFKSNAVPATILAAVSIAGLTSIVPVQLRTDSDNWKTFSANSDSALKNSEALSTKFRCSGLTYVIGGGSAGSTANEFYSPIANTWTNRGSLSTARYNHQAFAVSGVGFVAGGQNSSAVVIATSEQYNEISNVTSAAASLPGVIQGGTGYSLLEVGYSVMGGTTTNINSGTNVNYAYNKTLDSWSTKTVAPASLQDTSGWSLYDKGYVLGGADTGNNYQSSTYAYNPLTDAWQTLATAPSIDAGCTGFAFNSFGYRVAGINNNTTVYKYNQNLNSYSTIASTNVSHRHGGGNSADGFGYAYSSQSVDTTFEQFNDAAITWTNKAGLNTARYKPSNNFTPGVYRNYEARVGIPAYVAGVGGGVWATRTSMPSTLSGNENTFNLLGQGYFSGGYDGSNPSALSYQYNPDTDFWIQNISLAQARNADIAATLNSFGYVFGGVDLAGTTAYGSTEKWDPLAKTWTTTGATMNVARWSAGSCALNGFIYAVQGAKVGGVFGGENEKFDTSALTWTSKTANPNQWSENICESINGFMYSAEGHTGGTPQSGNNAYDDASNAWITKTSLNTARRAAGALFINNFMYACGGSGLTSVERYSDIGNVWTFAPPMLGARDYNSGFNLRGNAGYACGGSGPSSAVVAQFTPSQNKLVAGIALEIK